MKALMTLISPFRAFTLHSPAVAWRSVMPENRLGMIVCGAFLGLLAAVVMAKMREPANEPDKAVAAAPAETAAPKSAPVPMPPAAESEPSSGGTVPAPHNEPVSLPEPNVTAPPHPPAETPAPIKLPEPQVALNDHHPSHSDEITQAGVNLPAPVPDKTPKTPSTEQLPAPPSPGPMLEPPPPPPPASSLPPLDEKKATEEEENAKAKEEGNAKANDPKKDNKELKKPDKANPDKNSAPTPLPPNNGVSEPPLPGPPLPPGPPEPKKDDGPKVPMKIEAPPPPEPKPIKAEPAPAKVDPPLTPPEPPAPRQDKVTVVIPATPQPTRVEPPPFVPSPASPPIAPTPPSGAPLVDSWDERTYVAKPGDTYAAISLSEYKTEDYAKALQMYNQNHPRAGDAMRRDGTMAPGDRIYLPPSPVLEKRHADVIVRSKPKPVTAGTVGADGFGAVQADFRTQAAAPVNPTYKVKGNGETLFQIAAQQLHDGNRWGEIAALNPRAPTDSNVLGGTILQMPAASASTAPPVPHP